MAHTCPRCSMQCHCQADIDDINFGERWDCICCEGVDDEDDFYDDDYDDEGLTTTPPRKLPPQ